MKKFKTFFSLFLVIATFALNVLPASDASYASDETASTGSITGESSKPISALPAENDMYLVEDYNVVQGKTVLHISSCTWSPIKKISIGFFAFDENKEYKTCFTDGSISDYDISTADIPSGEYWIFLCNEGNESITGAINYYIYDKE